MTNRYLHVPPKKLAAFYYFTLNMVILSDVWINIDFLTKCFVGIIIHIYEI